MASGFKSPKQMAKSSKTQSIANATALTQQMGLVFSEIEDPRVARTRVHLLTDILIIGILSVIAGGKGWEDMENYGSSKHDWLKEFLALPNGIPCPDTFRRVFERINKECRRGKLPPPNLRPKVFERCFFEMGAIPSLKQLEHK